MKKLKNISIILICIMLFFSLLSVSKAANSDLYLNSLNFDVQINEDGSMDVTETWNIDIEDTNTLFKTFKKDNLKYLEITDGKVSRISSSGTEIPLQDRNVYSYHVPKDEYYFLDMGSNYEVAWGTGYESSSGEETYKISYHVEDAIAKYNDCSEMYWQFVGEDFEIPAKSITGTIKLPKAVENKEDLRVWGHTPDLNGTIYATSNDTVEFEVNNNKAEKMVEVRIAMPSNIIDKSSRQYNTNALENIIQEETGWANDANSARIGKLIISVIICLVIFGVLIYFLIKNILTIKNTKKVVPTTHYDYYRDIPRKDATPAEAVYIIENKYNGFDSSDIGRVFSSTLLNLALKKAIKIEQIVNEKGKEDSNIILLVNNAEYVTKEKDEIIVFGFLRNACMNKNNGIFGNNNLNSNNNTFENTITMKELKKYIEANTSRVLTLKSALDSNIKKELLDKKLLDNNGIKKRNKLISNSIIWFCIMFFGYMFLDYQEIITESINSIGIPWFVIVLMIILVIIDLITGSIAKNRISVYTQEGVDEQDKWEPFKKYMEDFSLLNEKDIPDLVLWEKFLVYATAFGISEKVIKGLKVVYPDYDNLDYSIYPNMYIFMHMDFARSFNSVSNSMSSTFSSGSGGGGGFSGGGGRRRRPAVVEAEDKPQINQVNQPSGTPLFGRRIKLKNAEHIVILRKNLILD